MALATYDDLVAAVPTWMARPGDAVITGNIDTLIGLAEQRIHYGAPEGSIFPTRALRCRGLETSRAIVIKPPTAVTASGAANAIVLTATPALSTAAVGDVFSFAAIGTNTSAATCQTADTPTANIVIGSDAVALAGGEIIEGATYQVYWDGTNFVLLPDAASCPLPPGYIGARSFYIPTSPRQYLTYVTPDIFNSTARQDSDTGQPMRYTVEAEALRFDPQPDTAYFPFMLYWKKLTGLSASNGTNWLMANAPNVYLYGVLLETSLFIRSAEGVQQWGPAFKAAIDGLMAADLWDRHPGGSLVMTNLSGNP